MINSVFRVFISGWQSYDVSKDLSLCIEKNGRPLDSTDKRMKALP